MRKTELARVFAMARKGAMKWNSFARTISWKRIQGEALFIVVKVVQVVFLYVYDRRQTKVRGEALLLVVKVVQVVFLYVLGISSQGKGKTICGFMGFPLAARAGNRTFAAENE